MWDIVGIRSGDMRPHFDGNLVNLYSGVLPEPTVQETEVVLVAHAREIARWVLAHREQFSRGDQFQIILGWPPTVRQSGRQVIKIGGGYEDLSRIADGTTPIVLRKGWTIKVFAEGETFHAR